MLYIGVDLGTSAVKLLMMDEEGKIQKIVSRTYPLYFPNPGWSEQNPEDWLEQTMEGMKELISELTYERPTEIANYIMKYVLNISKGRIQDDMTVLVMGFWENKYE